MNVCVNVCVGMCVRVCFQVLFPFHKRCFAVHVQRREHRLIEAPQEQKAKFAAWLDSVRIAADAGNQQPSVWMRSRGLSSKGLNSGGLSRGGDEGEGIEQWGHRGAREMKLMRKIFL